MSFECIYCRQSFDNEESMLYCAEIHKSKKDRYYEEHRHKLVMERLRIAANADHQVRLGKFFKEYRKVDIEDQT